MVLSFVFGFARLTTRQPAAEEASKLSIYLAASALSPSSEERLGLSNEREHSLTLGVLFTELLLVVLVLLNGPEPHLTCADGGEQRTGRVEGQNGKSGPGQELEEVVGARDQLESESTGIFLTLEPAGRRFLRIMWQ